MNQVTTKPRLTKLSDNLWYCTSNTRHYAEGASPLLAYNNWKKGTGFHAFYWRD